MMFRIFCCAVWAGIALVAGTPRWCPAQTQPAAPNAISISTDAVQTCPGLGACQGASEHDGFVYLYGDANPGVIRQYRYVEDGDSPTLIDTGLQIALTVNGVNVINHPTGLTWNPQFGTYLGNTITRTKQGTIYHLDWPRMLIDRNLDHAILNTIHDDLAVQGCRPEFVRRGSRWLLATADYGQVNNAVRFYDPVKLADAHNTSEPGVLVEEHACCPFVQQLHWIDWAGELLIVSNRTEGRQWRVTAVNPWRVSDYRTVAPDDELPETNELEGFTMIDAQQCLLVTSSRAANVTFGRVALRDISDRMKN